MDIVLVLTVAGVLGLIGGAVASAALRPKLPQPTVAVADIMPGRPVHVSTLVKARPVEGHMPRPGFVPFLEVPLEAGKWLILGDAGVLLATQGTDATLLQDWYEGGGLTCQIEVGEDRVEAGFQNIQIWAGEKGFAARGTLSLHMVVDIPTAAIAKFGWQVLPYQPKGHLDAGSSLTAVPINELKRHPESLYTEDYLEALAHRPDPSGFQMPSQ